MPAQSARPLRPEGSGVGPTVPWEAHVAMRFLAAKIARHVSPQPFSKDGSSAFRSRLVRRIPMPDDGQSERPASASAGTPAPHTPPATGIRDVSVVIVTWNREAALRRCLDSLTGQSFPRDRMEVVLVDVSDTPSRGIVAEYVERLRIKHVVASNLGCAVNRNVGAMHARHRWLAFIDDDCVAADDWLTELVEASLDDPRVMVGGRITIAADANVWAVLGQVVTEVVHATCNPSGGKATFLPGGCILVDRLGFLAAGGLEASFGLLGAEDRDFCDRWRRRGGELSYCASAVVRHDHRSTLWGFVRQQFNYGRGEWRRQLLLRQATPAGPDEAVAPPRRLRELLRDPLCELSPARRWQVLLFVPIWLSSYCAGIVWQRAVGGGGRAPGSDGMS